MVHEDFFSYVFTIFMFPVSFYSMLFKTFSVVEVTILPNLLYAGSAMALKIAMVHILDHQNQFYDLDEKAEDLDLSKQY